MADITDQVIIGLDFLKANNAVIDLRDRNINIQGIQVKAEVLKAERNLVSVARVLLKTKVLIPFFILQHMWWACLRCYLLDLQKRSVETLSQNQAHKVHDLLVEFQDVFAADDMDIGLFQGITHKVNTGDAQPVRAKLRRTLLGFEKEEEAHLKKHLDNGV